MRTDLPFCCTGLILLVTSLFLPFMEVTANSYGPRFQDLRLMVVMGPTKVGIFFLLHWSEVVLLVFGLVSYLLSYFHNFRQVSGQASAGGKRGLLVALFSLLVIVVDVTLVGMGSNLVHLSSARFLWGYGVFMAGYGLMVGGIFLTLRTPQEGIYLTENS